jgi:hypothetical protein
MDDEEEYLDYLMEEMKLEIATVSLLADVAEHVPVSALMFREVMERSYAAASEEEGKRILREFLKKVTEGTITPFQ